MTIENREAVKPGAKVYARYKGKDFEASVVQTKEGVRIELPDGPAVQEPLGGGARAQRRRRLQRLGLLEPDQARGRGAQAEGRAQAEDREESGQGRPEGQGEEARQGQGREQGEGQGAPDAGDGRTFVRLRRLPRDLRVAEGRGEPRADAHERLALRSSSATAGRFGGLLSLPLISSLPERALWVDGAPISIRADKQSLSRLPGG